MSAVPNFPRHYESTVTLAAPPEVAFRYLDDFKKLSAHMENPSTMTMGSKMAISTDALEGRAPGSKVHMEGRMCGVALSLDEVVTEREPPFTKAWQTTHAKLLVIGQYRLGFALSPSGEGSRLRVFIDYDVPHEGVSRWLGKLFGKSYARWCTEQMVKDAATEFNSNATVARP